MISIERIENTSYLRNILRDNVWIARIRISHNGDIEILRGNITDTEAEMIRQYELSVLQPRSLNTRI